MAATCVPRGIIHESHHPILKREFRSPSALQHKNQEPISKFPGIPLTMSRKAAAAAGDLVRGEAAILEFTKSNLTPERLRQRAAHFLMNPRSTRSIQGLSPEEKTKFLDRVDQVCRLPPEIRYSLIATLPKRHILQSTRTTQNSSQLWGNCAVQADYFQPQLCSPQGSRNVAPLL